MASSIHVVSKRDATKHTTVALTLQYPPLPASSVRVRTTIISISANNFSYASLGSVLHWWDTYPVPASAPTPYNDTQEWGIVPAWGYAEVAETSIEELPSGSLLWGFWPTSEHLVDLTLEATELQGRYRETSSHRAELMTLYNSYSLVNDSPSDETKAWNATMSIWAAGYLLNRFTFAEDAANITHPFGVGAWTPQDADISSAVVIVISASSKTGRSIVWNLGERGPARGPLGLLQVTSSPEQHLPLNRRSTFKSKMVSYDNLTTPETKSWISSLEPSRIVVLDVCGPAGTVPRLQEATTAVLPSTPFVLVGVGGPPEALSESDQREAMEAGARLGRLQFNASPVRDAGQALEGSAVFFQNLDAAFQRWLAEGAMGDMALSWGSGITGPDGVDKAWNDLCTGRLPRNKALAYRLA